MTIIAAGCEIVKTRRTFAKGALVPKITAKTLDQSTVENDPNFEVVHSSIAKCLPTFQPTEN